MADSSARSRRSPVIVIGGTGFVGRHIVEGIAKSGYDVITVSRNTPPRQSGIRHVAMDLCVLSPGLLAEFLEAERPHLIVNASGAVWRTDEKRMRDVNARLVAGLVESVRSLPWSPQLIHLGSIYEYAPIAMGENIDENTAQCPTSVYGQTKLAGSAAVYRAAIAGDVKGVVLRLCNITGRGSPEASLLGGLARRLSRLRGSESEVIEMGTLSGYRDFLDGQDVATAVQLAASRPVDGQVINLGRGNAVRIRRTAEMLIQASGLPIQIHESGTGVSAERNAGSDWTQVDTRPARTLLGWQPAVSLEESLRALWHEVSAPGLRGGGMHHRSQSTLSGAPSVNARTVR